MELLDKHFKLNQSEDEILLERLGFIYDNKLSDIATDFLKYMLFDKYYDEFIAKAKELDRDQTAKRKDFRR